MKYIKMLGLLAVSAAALLAFAGPASADTLTDNNGNGTPTIHAVSEGHVTLASPIANIQCPSTSQGSVTSHPAGGEVAGSFSVLTFGHAHIPAEGENPTVAANPCTNSWHVTVVTPGTLSIEASTGVVTSYGATVSTTRFGVTCNYRTKLAEEGGTVIGTFTDKNAKKNPNTLHINAQIPLHSGSSGLCGSGSAAWEGSYASTTELTLTDN